MENLLKIGQLKPHAPDAAEIERLLVAARRNLRDAGVTSISPETRFDAAYKAIMQSALAALMMHGYRPETNRPGHHMTVYPESAANHWPRIQATYRAGHVTAAKERSGLHG